MADETRARKAYSFLIAATCRAPEKILMARWSEVGAAAIDDLLWLSGELAVTPVLGRFARDYRASLSRDLARRLTAVSLMSEARGTLSLTLLKRILAHDSLQDSENVVIKGGGLTLAGLTQGTRYFVDIDVVIDEEKLDRWREAVRSCGAFWQPGAPGGYEAAYVTSEHSLIELHLALPGSAGSEHGPSYAELKRCSQLVSSRILVPSAAVAREIAVQHFVAHHNGEPGHALRTIQDLVSLEEAGEGEGLSWRDGGIADSVRRFRHIARAASAGTEEKDAQAAEFFDGLFRLVLTGRSAGEAHFSDAVDQWMESRATSGRSRLVLLATRIFPPPEAMRKTVGENSVITAARYVTRPARLLVRYLRGSFQRLVHQRHTVELRRWRVLIGSRRSRRR
ncbi:MAG TPA: nucleotidyltransferase family protein [Thermoanaerobaculia bacterium]|nr:nucleotidyltransferase family protein [Thermoanaerobaculia bacterium]